MNAVSSSVQDTQLCEGHAGLVRLAGVLFLHVALAVCLIVFSVAVM